MSQHKIRTIVECEAFENNKYSICPYADDLDEFLEGPIWALARNPMKGQACDDFGLVWAIKLDGWPARRINECVIYYRFDDLYVELLGILDVSTL